MIKGDRFRLFGHDMEVMVKKETLDVPPDGIGTPKDLFIYELACTCHSYPKHLTMNVTEDTLNLMLTYQGDPDE